MWRTPLVLGVLCVAACSSGDDGGPSTTVDADAALGSKEAVEAFESGDIADGGPVARIVVGPIDVLAVEGGDTGAGHVASSALPCTPGVSVIAGGTPFAELLDTTEGDTVSVTTPIGTCTYEVVQVATVAQEDFDPATAGVGRDGALVLVTPGAEDGFRDLLVAELDLASTTTTTATTAVPATTTTAPIVLAPQPTGRAAIDALLGAWHAGDRGFALAVADPAEVDELFAVPVGATQDRGCTQGDANAAVQCVYRLPNGEELQVRAAPSEGGFIVDHVLVSAP